MNKYITNMAQMAHLGIFRCGYISHMYMVFVGLPRSVQNIDENQYVVTRRKDGTIESISTKPEQFIVEEGSKRAGTRPKIGSITRNTIYFDEQGNPTKEVTRATRTTGSSDLKGRMKDIFEKDIITFQNGQPINQVEKKAIGNEIITRRTRDFNSGTSQLLYSGADIQAKVRQEQSIQRSQPKQYNLYQAALPTESKVNRSVSISPLTGSGAAPTTTSALLYAKPSKKGSSSLNQTFATPNDLLFTPVTENDFKSTKTKQQSKPVSGKGQSLYNALDTLGAQSSIFIQKEDPKANSLRRIALDNEIKKAQKKIDSGSNNIIQNKFVSDTATRFNIKIDQIEKDLVQLESRRDAAKVVAFTPRVGIEAEKEVERINKQIISKRVELAGLSGSATSFSAEPTERLTKINRAAVRSRDPFTQVVTKVIPKPFEAISKGSSELEKDIKKGSFDLPKPSQNFVNLFVPQSLVNKESITSAISTTGDIAKGVSLQLKEEPITTSLLTAGGFAAGTAKGLVGAGTAKLAVNTPRIATGLNIAGDTALIGIGIYGIGSTAFEASKIDDSKLRTQFIGKELTKAIAIGVGFSAGDKLVTLPRSRGAVVAEKAQKKLGDVKRTKVEEVSIVDQKVRLEDLPSNQLSSSFTGGKAKAVEAQFSPFTPPTVSVRDTKILFGNTKTTSEPLKISFKDGTKTVSQPAQFISEIKTSKSAQGLIETTTGQKLQGTIQFKPTKTQTKIITGDKIVKQKGFEATIKDGFIAGTERTTGAKASRRIFVSQNKDIFIQDKGAGSNQLSSINIASGKNKFVVVTNSRRVKGTTTKVFDVTQKLKPILIGEGTSNTRIPIVKNLKTASVAREQEDFVASTGEAAARRLRRQVSSISAEIPKERKITLKEQASKLLRNKRAQKLGSSFEERVKVTEPRINVGTPKPTRPTDIDIFSGTRIRKGTTIIPGTSFKPISSTRISSIPRSNFKTKIGSSTDTLQDTLSIKTPKFIDTTTPIYDIIQKTGSIPKKTSRSITSSLLIGSSPFKPTLGVIDFTLPLTPLVPPVTNGSFNFGGVGGRGSSNKRKRKKKQRRAVTPSIRATLFNIKGKIKDSAIISGLQDRPLDFKRLKL